MNAEQWKKLRKVPLHHMHGFDKATGTVEVLFFAGGEFDNTVGNGENCVVFTHFHALAGEIFAAALTDNDVTGNRQLARGKLDA